MKEPERLTGFVFYEEEELAFEFDKDAYVLNLYPSKEQWERYSGIAYFTKNLRIYAMELKQTGLDGRTCGRAIGRLFGENRLCSLAKNSGGARQHPSVHRPGPGKP